MGMYDMVIIEDMSILGLSGSDAKSLAIEEWQTKDFDCAMTNIKITREGRLVKENFDYEEVPKNERPYPDAEDGSLQSITGIVKKVNREWVDKNFSGVFNFYTSSSVGWFEFNAVFVNGKLESVHRKEDN